MQHFGSTFDTGGMILNPHYVPPKPTQEKNQDQPTSVVEPLVSGRQCKDCKHWYYTFDGQYDERCRLLKIILVDEKTAESCEHFYNKGRSILNVVLPSR